MMMSTVIGGAMLPHAPQFFTMPETEDKKNVERVREVAAEIGKKLRALKPDVAAADHDQMLGQEVHVHHAGIGKIRHLVDARHIGDGSPPSDIEDYTLRLQHLAVDPD